MNSAALPKNSRPAPAAMPTITATVILVELPWSDGEVSLEGVAVMFSTISVKRLPLPLPLPCAASKMSVCNAEWSGLQA